MENLFDFLLIYGGYIPSQEDVVIVDFFIFCLNINYSHGLPQLYALRIQEVHIRNMYDL